MDEAPADLLAALPGAGVPVAQQWWASLSEADRRRIGGLWDGRHDVCFFAPPADGAGRVGRWEQVPAVRGGHAASSWSGPFLVASKPDAAQNWWVALGGAAGPRVRR
jgi:hypothetical protein